MFEKNQPKNNPPKTSYLWEIKRILRSAFKLSLIYIQQLSGAFVIF